jgi:hypothetical protein
MCHSGGQADTWEDAGTWKDRDTSLACPTRRALGSTRTAELEVYVHDH